MVTVKTIEDVKNLFAHTLKKFGIYSISADQNQIEAVTGKTFENDKINTEILVFDCTGFDITVFEKIKFFEPCTKNVRFNAVHETS